MNKLFEMLVLDELIDGVFAISFVDSPAIQTDYVLLSDKDNKITIDIKLEKLVDKKRKIVCGPALIPDMIIPRKGYDIKFSAETIRKISENFLINGNKDNVTLQHKVSVNKINLVESWIVDDSNLDKSKKLGYDVPVGTWMVSFKVNDDALWNEYIESGTLKGFSIEGNFSQKEISLSGETEEFTEYDKEVELAIYDLYLALTYPAKELNSYYLWKKNDGDNCPSCIKFNNQVKKLSDWINTAIPATQNGTQLAGTTCNFPYSPYGTYCEDNCNCKLVKVNAPSFKKKYIKKPF